MEQKKIDWSVFESSEENKYFKPEVNVQYRLGFSGVEAGQAKVKDDETGLEKVIPTLEMTVDYLNGEKVSLIYSVTSKLLAKQVKMYWDEGLLFSSVFALKKEGEKYQTKYFLSALGQKKVSVEEQKREDAKAFI